MVKSEWQAIETAPKDGTRIIISNGGWVDTGYWSESFWARGGAWVQEEWGSDTYCFEGVTHWMPLPAPPASLTGGREP